MRIRWPVLVLPLLLVLCLGACPRTALSQNASGGANSANGDFTSEQIFRPPMADPFEPASRIRFGGSNLDFGLALPLPVFTSEDKTSAWQLGFLGGITARFGSERTTLYLKSADFHAGIPFSFRKDKWSGRIQFYHVSSHLGGDYENLSGLQPFHYSREALQALIAYDGPHRIRIYGGPTLLVRTYPKLGRWTLQAGTEWFPKSGKRWQLYVADDFQTRGEVGWQTSISFEPGVELSTKTGQPVARVEAWLYSGEAPFGELYRVRDHVAGAQLIFTLEPALKSLITHRHSP